MVMSDGQTGASGKISRLAVTSRKMVRLFRELDTSKNFWIFGVKYDSCFV